MDRFVVRTTRSATISDDRKGNKKRLKQATIECLKGVVIIEDILKFKTLLRQPGQNREIILDCLQKLDKKIPGRDIIKSTKIGHTVRKLTKHKDRDVAEFSTKIVKKWLSHYEAKLSRPLIDVKCDNETEKVRSAGRKHLAKALQLSSTTEDVVDSLSECIEREVFHRHKRLVDSCYRRMLRKLIFALKEEESLRQDVLQQNLTIADFIARHHISQ